MTEINKGNYFLYCSLLKEASESWINDGKKTKCGIFFMKLVGANKNVDVKIFSCDRARLEMKKTGHVIVFSPALFDIINFKSVETEGELDDVRYALKVASQKSTLPFPVYFIVPDEEKETIKEIAERAGYSIKIKSPDDFNLV